MHNLNVAALSGLKFDGFLTIATGRNRKSRKWKNHRVSWSKLLKKFSVPTWTDERQVDYLMMPKDKQDDIKDVGGFVGGTLKGERRVAENVENRQLVTLDADFAPYDFWEELTVFFPYACCIYSTHKHSRENPRYRWVIPLDREVSPDEYQAISRKIAEMIDINYFDDTTYQAHRLMYYPSTSKDAEYVFQYQDAKWLSVDTILDEYDDWEDQTSWPISDRATKRTAHILKHQEDPLQKSGIIGAFCRAYTIQEAIDTFLPNIYTRCNSDDRYTYTAGSSSGGAVIYDNKWLYSHHATDPCSMQLVNAFDLVRIHKFRNLDERTRLDDATRKPSYQQMCEFASKDKKTRAEIAKERLEEAGRDFTDLGEDTEEQPDMTWTGLLQVNAKTGQVLSTRFNIETILKNDPVVKDTFGYEEFTQRIAIRKMPKWRHDDDSPYWTDTDEANLRSMLETCYEINSKAKVDDGILTVAHDNSFHVVRDFLNSLVWDGVPRVDSLFIDFLGAEDNDYTRQVTRKTLVAAVSRVMNPGCKFDTMTVLVGPQGIGKSYLLKRLGGRWFSDSVTSLTGKESYEQLRGVWIEEMSELSAMKKSDIESVKQYITKQVDTYRPAYGKQLQDFPRQCVFIGTTNTYNFLRDKTGNRRFYPIDTGILEPTKSLFDPKMDAYVRQVWAEVMNIYQSGENLILDEQAIKYAQERQQEHMEENPLEGALEAYLDMEVPENWYDLDIRARRDFTHGDGFDIEMGNSFVRDKICTLEIWCELLNGDLKNLDSYNRREIRETLDNLKGWKRAETSQGRKRFGKVYGAQRAWIRKEGD